MVPPFFKGNIYGRVLVPTSHIKNRNFRRRHTLYTINKIPIDIEETDEDEGTSSYNKKERGGVGRTFTTKTQPYHMHAHLQQ